MSSGYWLILILVLVAIIGGMIWLETPKKKPDPDYETGDLSLPDDPEDDVRNRGF